MTDCTIDKEREGDRIVFRLGGVFDRASAWNLRKRIEGEVSLNVLLDFSLVSDFSDLGVAVLAHGITNANRRILLRGLRQHQLRIFRYCGVPVDETSARDASAGPTANDSSGAEGRV